VAAAYDIQWVTPFPGVSDGTGVDVTVGVMVSPSWSFGIGLRSFNYDTSNESVDFTSVFGEGRYYSQLLEFIGRWRLFVGGRMGFLHASDPRLEVRSPTNGLEASFLSGAEILISSNISFEFTTLPVVRFFSSGVSGGVGFVFGMGFRL